MHQKRLEVQELFSVWHLAEEKQINNLLKAEAVVGEDSAYDVVDVVASVVQLALAGYELAVDELVLLDRRDVGKTCQNALAVDVAQSALNVVLAVKRRVYLGVLRHFLREKVDLRCIFRIIPGCIYHRITPFHFSLQT